MFYDQYCKLCEERGKSPSAAAVEAGISKSAVSTWKNLGRTPKVDQLQKLAVYFGVSVNDLIGEQKDPTARSGEVTDDDIKFALFGGGPVTDAQYEEVKQFVRFIKERDANGNRG